MKQVLAVLLLSALSSQAGLVFFELSPPGKDTAVGLSPSNEVPVVTNSTGSGGPISGGVVFDSASQVLQAAIGYGSAAGFTDLSGPAIAMHIHGPAAPGQAAPPIVDLMPFNFSAANPTNGGIIFGNIAFPTNSISNLLAGLTYVNVHTALNPEGEIRAQLVPLSNSPPQLICPGDATVECATTVTYTAHVFDPEGDAVTVVWSVNGVALQTNSVAAQNPPTVLPVIFTGSLPLGTNVLTVTATDTATNTVSCSATITVVDTIPPVITSASASPNVLWPPNHKFVPIAVRATVTDACGPTTWKIVSVSSNEPGNGTGDGNTSPDWVITGAHTVKLRAERSGNDSGRVYSIAIQATDAAGNLSSESVVNVNVPHDRGHGKK